MEDLIGMKVQLSSRGKAVELMIEETVEIRVAVLSKLSSRLQPELDKVNKYEVSNKDMKQLVDKNSLVQLSELADDKLETATLSMMKDISTQSGNVLEDIEDFNNEDSKKELDESSVNLLGLTIDGDQTLPVEYGPILFGTVCFRCCVIAPDDVLKPTVLSDDGATASVILNTEAKLEQLHHSQNTPEITAPQDVIFLDLVGYLQAGPTVAVSPILPLIVEHSVDTTTSNEVNLRSGMRRDVLELLASTDKANKVRERIDDAVIFHAVRASSRTSPFYPTLSNDANPVLELEEYEQQFYLHNPSEIHTLNFTIESSSYRLAGMQLALYDSTHVAAVNGSDRGVYDTITISTVPNHGVIPPHSSIIVKAMLIPGAVADANKVYPIEHSIRRGDLYLLSKMSILIKDNSWPSQPPRQMTVVLSSSTPIQRFMTQPVSATNRSKKTSLRSSDRDSKLSSVILNNQNDGGEISKAVLEIGDGRKNASQLEEVKERDRFQFNSADPSADSATIRLRGLTPHSTLQGRYTIDLGLQSQKKEFLEWLITLENNSMSHPTIVKVMLGAQEDKSWLTVGQTKSFIAEGDSVSVMLYFNRATIGIFSGYVIVENTEKLLDRQIIRVQMTVASLSSNITTSNGVPSVGTILSGDAPNVDRSNKSRLRPVLKLSLDSMETFDDTVEAVIDTADAKSFPSAQLLDDSALLFAQKLVGFTLTISSLVDFDLEVVVLLTVHNQYAERFRLSLANNSGVIETSKGSNRLGGINNLSCKLHSRDYCKFSVVVEDLYHENLDDRDGDLLNSADNNLALDTFKPINKRSSDDVPSEMQKTAIGMISIECRQFEDQNRSISLLWIG